MTSSALHVLTHACPTRGSSERVDLPASQQMKLERLAAAGLQPGRNVADCPIDLERDDLAEALCQAGLDRSRPTFFSWLGVSPYLTRAANLKTIDDRKSTRLNSSH